MAKKIIIALISLVLLLNQSGGEEVYENSTRICDRCTCTESDDAQILTMDCSNQDIKHSLSNWPKHNKTLIASFAGNTITTLELLPATDAVVEVVFKNCAIKYLDSGLFEGVKNIQFVDLSYNLLTAEEVSADKFKGPYNDTQLEPLALEHLNLAYNQIHSFSKNIFEHLPKLRRLNLEGNDFVVLDLHTQLAISSVLGLESLNMANNGLTELVDDAIAGTNLTELDLGRNRLDFVPDSLRRVGKTLQLLVLDGNPIIAMNEQSFLGLHNILELSANNLTELKYVNANAFVPMPKLKKLSLSNNLMLLDIAREAFGINQTLEEFYLNNNRLYKLDYKLLNWSNLRVFEFNENPLDCSCDLYNITTALSTEITKIEDGPFCYDFRNSRSTAVFYLQSDICGARPYQVIGARFVTHHFTILRISLLALSVVLLLGVFVAASLGYTRFKKFQRNRNYPFASQVLYNPLSTGGGRF